MPTDRYIPSILARDVADTLEQAADAARKSSDAAYADKHRERAVQMGFRIVDLDRRFGI